MSQSKIKSKPIVHQNVRLTMQEVRDNACMGGEGLLKFLEWNIDEPGNAIVIVDLVSGGLSLDLEDAARRVDLATKQTPEGLVN